MKVYQIVLGKLPGYLESCVNSVLEFTKRCNHDYQCIVDVPQWEKYIPSGLSYFRNRLIKDWICIELLSTEPNIMIVDWDVYLTSDFVFDGDMIPVFASRPLDCMIYNSADLSHFKRVLKIAGNYSEIQPGELLTAGAIYKYRKENPGFMYKNFEPEQYKHLDNCRLMQ